MNAVDTNVVVRYLTDDHETESARAKILVDGGRAILLTTVLLECEWVLRNVYGFSKAIVLERLEAFASLPTITVEQPARVRRALNAAGRGMDFADALHLAGIGEETTFYTFDKTLIRRAKAQSAIKVIAP